MAVFKDAKALFKNTARYLNDYIVHERANIYFENTVKVMRKEIKAHHDDAYEIEYENKAEGVATRRLTIVPKKGHESKALMYEYKMKRRDVWRKMQDVLNQTKDKMKSIEIKNKLRK